jgi:hypothetical protein
MSVPAALTAIVIILGIIALVVVGVLVLAAILMLRLLRIERQLRADVSRVRERIRATVEEVGQTAQHVTSTVNSWGSGARYAGLAAEAAGALLAWRKKSRGETPKQPRMKKARIVGWLVPTGVIALELVRRLRKSSGRSGKDASG